MKMEHMIFYAALVLCSAVFAWLMGSGWKRRKQRWLLTAVSVAAVSALCGLCGTPLELLRGFIFTMILLKAAVSDIQTREVDDHLSVMLFIAAFIGDSGTEWPGMIVGLLIVSLPMLFVAIRMPGKIGGADIKIMAAASFFLGFHKGLAAVMIGLMLAVAGTLMIQKFRRKSWKDSFPLIPYLSAGCYTALILINERV
jgi:leader peptidase (prepilin peptidase)/N-methyltransferase